MCLATDSPGRDPNVISTSSHRSQSALGSNEAAGHKALVLKVQCISYIIEAVFSLSNYLVSFLCCEEMACRYSVY